ncbi:MAG: hypothetical protein ACUVX8_09925 [Candidatus Zipacnadales bacterium]
MRILKPPPTHVALCQSLQFGTKGRVISVQWEFVFRLQKIDVRGLQSRLTYEHCLLAASSDRHLQFRGIYSFD